MRSRRSFIAAAALLSLVTALSASGTSAGTQEPAAPRLDVPEDRYAMAGGCYTIRSAAANGFVGRSANGFGVSATAEPFHFQATDLGKYLLFGTAQDFLAASEGLAGAAAYAATTSTPGAHAGGLTIGTTDQAADAIARGPVGAATGRGAGVVAAKTASELADWEIDEVAPGEFTITLPATKQSLVAEAGTLALVTPATTDARARFALALAEGCATFPEVEVNVSGDPLKGTSAVDEATGFIDLHVHMMAFEFIGGRTRCGRPWHPYGVGHALVDCVDHGPHGETAVLEMVLSGGDPVTGHSPEGWPSFQGWPKPGSLTHEQIYYKWLERAWRGGLRLMTNLLVDNHALCVVYPYKKNSCNEMDGVRLQAQRIRELERYIDAQSGGPGEGWFRIVTDPFEAREVVNAGQLAVVLGIEISTPFDCNVIEEQPLCDEKQIDDALTEVFDLGVRQMELANKFDNALTGVTGDSGSTGVVVNSGNRSETGHFWKMETCPDEMGEANDKLQYNAHDQGAPDQLTGRDAIFGAVLQVSGASGVAPVYPEGPHCNTIGLTELGEHALQGMIDRGMIFDPDHMSARARQQALTFMEERGYSGVVSSHSWADKTIYPRIYELGGVVTPHAGGSTGFASSWNGLKDKRDARYYFGFGYGSDVNGFSNQGAPRRPTDLSAVTYPFTGLGGVQIHKQQSGTRTYDVNVDGVAHYGLYPDWIEDLRHLAGDQIVADLARGAEAFLQMWERATGIAPDACRDDVPDLDDGDVAAVQAGMNARAVLEAIGQPRSRQDRAFSYCMNGGRTATVSFGLDDTVAGVTIA